jgi:hypothetical protein
MPYKPLHSHSIMYTPLIWCEICCWFCIVWFFLCLFRSNKDMTIKLVRTLVVIVLVRFTAVLNAKGVNRIDVAQDSVYNVLLWAGWSTFGCHITARGFLTKHLIKQWYSNWGISTPGGTRKHFRGYVKLKKNKYYFMISIE